MTRKSMLPVPVKGKLILRRPGRTVSTQTRKCVIRTPPDSMSSQEAESFTVENNEKNNDHPKTSRQPNYVSTPNSPNKRKTSSSKSESESDSTDESIEKTKHAIGTDATVVSKLAKSISTIKKSSSQHEFDFSQMRSQLNVKRKLIDENNSNTVFRFEITNNADSILASQQNEIETIQEINEPRINDSTRSVSPRARSSRAILSESINLQEIFKTPIKTFVSSNRQTNENQRATFLADKIDALSLDRTIDRSRSISTSLENNLSSLFNQDESELQKKLDNNQPALDFEGVEEQNYNIHGNDELMNSYPNDEGIPSTQIPTTSNQKNSKIQNKRSNESIERPVKRKKSSARLSINRRIPNVIYNNYDENSAYFSLFSLEDKKEILSTKEKLIEELSNPSPSNELRRSERLRLKQIKKLNNQKMTLRYLIRMDEQEIEMNQQANRRFRVNLKYVNVRKSTTNNQK